MQRAQFILLQIIILIDSFMKKTQSLIKGLLEQNILLPSPTPSPTIFRNSHKMGSESKQTTPTPLKMLDQSDDDISSADKQQFLMLEIKQLKRQNNFLKKKIADLTAQITPEKPQKKKGKQKQKQKGAVPNLESMPLSINIFFEQIHNLLNTIVKLFRINFTAEQIAAYQKKQNEQITQRCPIKKHVLLKKYMLKRKMERILLEKEEGRYPLVLDLFTQYYQFKEQSDQKIISTIDTMTTKAHELNQWIISKAQEKKNKSRKSFTTVRKQEDMQVDTQNLQISTNIVINSKSYTSSSMTNRNPKKTPKFAMSPSMQRFRNFKDL